MKIGIISDIHEDISSLKEAVEQLEKSNCSEIVCLGDITGYDKVFYKKISIQNASECISVIRTNCKYTVAGNHDFHCVKKVPEVFGKLNLPADWYEIDLNERKKLYRKAVWLYDNESLPNLEAAEREYLYSLPEYLTVNFNGINVFLSHSAYPDFTGSVVHRPHNPWDLHKHFQYIKIHNCSIGFSGHMHSRGVLKINLDSIKLLSFGIHSLKNELAQYFCPCLANTNRKKGFLIFEPDTMSIEAVRLKSKNKKWFTLYERLQNKY